MKKIWLVPTTAALWLVLLACGFPAFVGNVPTIIPSAIVPTGTLPANTPGATQSPTATVEQVISTVPPTETVTVVPTTCTPTIVATTETNIRSGPGTDYSIVGSLPTGGSAVVAGKIAGGAWWYIEFAGGAGGHAWIAASLVIPNCIPETLAYITAPPTPVPSATSLPASGVCKDGYVHRLIKSSDKVCVTQSSKDQAHADNAAAASRLATATYGPDTCVAGYVWREAYSNDHVCVLPAVHNQALADNSAAASRWILGSYGLHTCISGFVWREARSGDDVCVTGANRTQAAADNAAAASRKVTATYGPDTCATGYVWRMAFSNDHVCVTPAVQAQTAADNAAAPSHTW